MKIKKNIFFGLHLVYEYFGIPLFDLVVNTACIYGMQVESTERGKE